MTDLSDDERRRLEKITLFPLRYSTRGKTLAHLADMKPLSWYARLWQKITGMRCMTCGVKLNDAYWKARDPDAGRYKFSELIRLICEDRQRCMECAMAEERLEAEQRRAGLP